VVRLVDLGVCEEGFDEVLGVLVVSATTATTECAYLAIVECAVYGQVVHVGVHDSRHLRLLDRADLAMRVHDEDRHILLSAQTVNGC